MQKNDGYEFGVKTFDVSANYHYPPASMIKRNNTTILQPKPIHSYLLYNAESTREETTPFLNPPYISSPIPVVRKSQGGLTPAEKEKISKEFYEKVKPYVEQLKTGADEKSTTFTMRMGTQLLFSTTTSTSSPRSDQKNNEEETSEFAIIPGLRFRPNKRKREEQTIEINSDVEDQDANELSDHGYISSEVLIDEPMSKRPSLTQQKDDYIDIEDALNVLDESFEIENGVGGFSSGPEEHNTSVSSVQSNSTVTNIPEERPTQRRNKKRRTGGTPGRKPESFPRAVKGIVATIGDNRRFARGNLFCCCCEVNMKGRFVQYRFRSFPAEYKAVFPGAPRNDTDFVCSTCYATCRVFRKTGTIPGPQTKSNRGRKKKQIQLSSSSEEEEEQERVAQKPKRAYKRRKTLDQIGISDDEDSDDDYEARSRSTKTKTRDLRVNSQSKELLNSSISKYSDDELDQALLGLTGKKQKIAQKYTDSSSENGEEDAVDKPPVEDDTKLTQKGRNSEKKTRKIGKYTIFDSASEIESKEDEDDEDFVPGSAPPDKKKKKSQKKKKRKTTSTKRGRPPKQTFKRDFYPDDGYSSSERSE